MDIDQLTKQLNEIQLFKALHEFDEKLSNQAKFLRNFMNLIQIMMLFIRASRQGLWELHLSALEKFKVRFCLRSVELCSPYASILIRNVRT